MRGLCNEGEGEAFVCAGHAQKEAEKRQRKADEKNAAAASRERRRLERRNTDDRVDRILAQKLYPRFSFTLDSRGS